MSGIRQFRSLFACALITVIAIHGDAARAQGQPDYLLAFGEEREIPRSEIIDLLELPLLVELTITVSATGSPGSYGASAALAPNGALSCRVDGDDVILEAGSNGPAASGTCHLHVCRMVALLEVCNDEALSVASVACRDDNLDGRDVGCSATSPVCEDDVATPHCVECESDADCSMTRYGLGLGEVLSLASSDLMSLLGLDLGAQLTTLQVSNQVNGPFSDEALLANDMSCDVTADGHVQVHADEATEGASTCYVELCTELLGIGSCTTLALDAFVAGCLVTGTCDLDPTCRTATGTCDVCRDDGTPGGSDPGCDTTTPACLASPEPVSCVECTSDDDCGSDLMVLLAPLAERTIARADLLDMLGLANTLVPSSAGVSADVDGPFTDAALLGAGAQLANCALDDDGDVVLTAAGAEGTATCYVQLCVNALGPTVTSCLVLPINLTTDLCVLDNSCHLGGTCAADNTCGGCNDNVVGDIDQGCDGAAPACSADSCVECTVDADCTPRHPLLHLDLLETGFVDEDELLGALDLSLLTSVDSLQVAADAFGPFSDEALLDVDGEVASCTVSADGRIELVAADTYGWSTCYVEVCAEVIAGSASGCFVVPIELNVDPCAADDSCAPPFCQAGNNQCTVCLDDHGPGQVDTGCGALPACLVVSGEENHCVECIADADCGGGAICTADHRCQVCEDDSASGRDNGCTNQEPLCDEGAPAIGDERCGDCIDDTVGAVDNGCTNGNPACDEAGNNCVDCTVDADCDGNDHCDVASHTCQACDDTASGAGQDQGCSVGDPICDLTRTPDACVTCLDDTVGGQDTGCNSGDPACDATGDTCVDCTVDADCDPGEVCDGASHTCAPCVDSSSGTAQDAGCPAETPLCDATQSPERCASCFDDTVGGQDTGCGSADAACDEAGDVCVDCTVDADCGAGSVCDEPTHSCHPCLDSAGGGGQDEGCIASDPICDTAAEPDRCVHCNDDTVGGLDTGCNAGDPACDGASDSCVDCTVNSDCDGGEVCNTQTHTCHPCLDSAAAAGQDLGCQSDTPICDLTREPDACVVCLDDALSGADTGCGGETPLCDDSATPRCVECDDDGDCDSGDECNAGAGRCVDPASVDAFNDTYTSKSGTQLKIAAAVGVLANDAFPAGTTSKTVTLEGAAPDPATATLVLRADGSFDLTIAPRVTDTITFTYRVTTNSGGTDTATVRVIIIGQFSDPVALVDDVISTPEDTAVTFDPRLNDHPELTGAAPDTVTRVVAAPAHGIAVIHPDGTVTYTPAADYHGSDSFQLELCDSEGTCGVSSVSVTVAPVNDPPHAFDDEATTPEETPVWINVAANDGDVDGEVGVGIVVTAVTILEPPAHGSVEVLEDGSVVYTPDPDFAGFDVFDYQLCDAQGACSEGQVLVTVTPVNDAPVANDDVSNADPGASVTVDVLINDLDADGDPLHVESADGGAVVSEDGTLTVTAPSEGKATVSYVVCDDSGACDTGTLTIDTTPIADPALMADDLAETTAGMEVIIDVLDNDVAPAGDALHITGFSRGRHGAVEYVSDELGLRYVPDDGWVGDDVFGYSACAANGSCGVAHVYVTVAGGDNRPPLAVDDAVATQPGMPVGFDATDNDLDPDGDPLVVVATGQPAHGTVQIAEDGSLVYVPDEDFVGSDSFEVTIGDGQGGTDTSIVTVTVSVNENRAPVAVGDAYTVATALESELDVLVNDSDPDGDTLVIIGIVQPLHGSAVLGATGIVYTSDADFIGTDRLSYRIDDGHGGFDEAVVDVTVGELVMPKAPVAVGDEVTTPEDTPVTIAVLTNDSDADGEVAALVVAEDVPVAAHGVIEIGEDGRISYTPHANYHGADSFAYEVCDASGLCDSAMVAVTVTPVNDGPDARDDQATLAFGQSASIEVLANDVDLDGDVLGIGEVTDPEHGTTRIEDGFAVYVPDVDFEGDDSFEYTACDGDGWCDRATVTVSVGEGENHRPDARDDSVPVAADAVSVVIDVLANDADPDGDTLMVASTSSPSTGTTRILEGSRIELTPDSSFEGAISFGYQACDPGGLCDEATVTVTVTWPEEPTVHPRYLAVGGHGNCAMVDGSGFGWLGPALALALLVLLRRRRATR